MIDHAHHRDVVSVEEDLVELGDPPSLGRGLVLGDVLEHHVDEVVEAEEGAHDLLVVLHDDVDARPDRLVHQLCSRSKIHLGYFISDSGPIFKRPKVYNGLGLA